MERRRLPALAIILAIVGGACASTTETASIPSSGQPVGVSASATTVATRIPQDVPITAPSTASAATPPPSSTLPLPSPSDPPSPSTQPPSSPSPSPSTTPPPSGTTAITAGTVDRTSVYLRAVYDVKLTLDYEDATYRVDSTMRITNESSASIDRLELNTISANLGRMRNLTAIVDGTSVTPRIDDMTLHVPLGGVLGIGDSATLRIRFNATLRSGVGGSDWLLTRNTGIITMYRWLPWVSLERPFARPSFGFPFLTRVSPRVTVAITTDRAMRISTGGERTSVDGMTQTFESRNVRDFNIAASPWYQIRTGATGGTTVQVFYRANGPGQELLDSAKRALTRLRGRLGEYPWPVLHVAIHPSREFGAASPRMVWLPTGITSANMDYFMTHEIAHQWFFGVVGNDLAKQPFAHEATSEFMTRHLLGLQRASRCSTSRLDRTIYQYASSCFYEIVYVQGSLFLDTVRRRMGDTAFWRGVKSYLADHRFGFGGSKVFLDALDRATSLDLRPLFDSRFPSYY